MTSESPESALRALAGFGALDDSAIDPGEGALLFAALFRPGVALERYRSHLRKLANEVAERFAELVTAGAGDTAETRLAALKHILCDRHGYQADRENADPMLASDLIHVIDHARGGALTLGILYIAAARAQGWKISGLSIPGHFALRLDEGAQRPIFDPSDSCRILQAADLRRLVKKARGGQAELSADYYRGAGNREILIRLQNQIKLRQVEAEDYEGALRSVAAMRALDPREFRLLLDEGVLCARTGRKDAAIAALEDYMTRIPGQRDRREAAALLAQIRNAPE